MASNNFFMPPRSFQLTGEEPEYASYDEELQDIEKRKALADALLNRGLFSPQNREGRMVGGRWIRPGMSEGIQQAANVYSGMKLGEESRKKGAEVRGRQQAAIQDWMKPLVSGVEEKKAFVAPGFDEADVAATSQGLQSVSQRPMNRGELMGHYMKGMNLGGPAASVSAQGLNTLLQQQGKQPKWEIQERYNPETGRKEKAWVDMNAGPGGPAMAFGGQAQPDVTDAKKKMLELTNMGVPQPIAEGIAYGYLQLGTAPDGSTILINKKEAAGGVPAAATPGFAPPGAGGQPPQTVSQPPLQPSGGVAVPGAVPPPQAPSGPPQSPYAPSPAAPGTRVLAPGSKPQERLQVDTEQMGKVLETKLVPTTLAGIKEVDTILSKLPKGPRGSQGDIPGFGTIAGSLPAWALSQEGKDLRAAAKSVSNKLLQAQSGLAVTDQENRRFLEQIQQGVGMSDTDFKNGWARIKAEVQSRLDNVKGSFHPDVIGEYSKRNPGFQWNVGGGGAAPVAPPTGNPADEYFR